MVVRPASEGNSRRSYSEKKMALMSSVLPRANSATKAMVSRSDLRASTSSKMRSSVSGLLMPLASSHSR